eukprot:13401684-Heterocapsa_arctica.AAC.1
MPSSKHDRGWAFRGLLDERVFEAQNCVLKPRICAKRSAHCEEFNGANEDVRIRKCDCLI